MILCPGGIRYLLRACSVLSPVLNDGKEHKSSRSLPCQDWEGTRNMHMKNRAVHAKQSAIKCVMKAHRLISGLQ